MSSPVAKEVIVAVTGASGAIYASRLMRALLINGHTVHVILSKYGRYLLHEELDMQSDKESITEFLARVHGEEVASGRGIEYGVNDLTGRLASGSGQTAGMVVVPCSTKTLSGIACGGSTNLIERSADVTLKEERPLVLVPRETPLNLIQLGNLIAAAEAGASILPAMPAFYQKPATFDDLADFIAGRILNLLRIEHTLFTPWRSE